jgi:hypothetical protein
MTFSREGAPDIDELVRRAGVDALWSEAEAFGLKPLQHRALCPFPGCGDKGDARTRSVVIVGGRAHPRLFCHRCHGTGDLVDLLELSRGLSRAEAVEHLRGAPAPALRVVKPAALTLDEPEKLAPKEVQRLWGLLTLEDAEAQAYLDGRGLHEALELGLVRFANAELKDKQLGSLGRRGYRVAVLQKDVVGEPRGIQFRNVRPVQGATPKVLSLKGSSPKRGFFGSPELVESSAVVAVTEGLADTLAVSAWATHVDGVVVVGAAGKGFLSALGEQLVDAGVPLEGKTFALFVQNDAPKNVSRREFIRLKQVLVKHGAEVVLCSVPDAECKDVADYLQRHPDAHWPPAELARVLVPEPGDDTPREAPATLAPGCAVELPASLDVPLHNKSFSTLCALLADPSYRLPIMGRGELELDEMTGSIRLDGREVISIDLSAIRLKLERECKTTDGKPLMFQEPDIAKALELVARRRTVHPVREWLGSLKWDGEARMDRGLPVALGQEPGSFAALLLSRWLISAVARPMSPGCKVDTVLVLVGEQQGEGKSTFFNVLAGDEWFTDSQVDVGDKDSLLLLRKKWIVEWGELNSMRRARDKETVRAFVSQRIDHFREPYGRGVITAPRGCIIVGSTNNLEFLSDFERRFWPIHVPSVDLDWVRASREQLLAEAVHRYRAGETWYLQKAEHATLAQLQEAHRERHPWHELVQDWLSGRPALERVTTTQVLIECLNKPQGQVTRGESMAVAGILRELGWKSELYGKTNRRLYMRPRTQTLGDW